MNPLLSYSPILLPILYLVIWTLVQMVWMIAIRLPAISAANLGPEAAQRTDQLAAQLPKEIQWKADNYNHLLEQPTIFYACALVLAIAGLGEGLNLYLAWGYVVLRIIHSIVQSTVNPVLPRFGLFMLGSIMLAVMAVNGVMSLLG